MADMMSTLKGFLGDDAEDKIKNAMNMLSGSGILDNVSENEEKGISQKSAGTPSLPPEGLEMLMQLKGMADRISTANDSRSNLLMSLRPFMRTERQQSIDRMVKLMNIGRFSGLFGR